MQAVNLGSCISNIPIQLHWSFFLLLLLEFANAVLSYNSYPLYILFVVILYGPILLLTIVVHELGHALMTKRLGGSVGGIVLWPLGGFALCGPTEALSGDLKVALAGPLMHVPMGLLWWIIYVAVTGGKNGLWPSWVIYLDTLSNSAAGFFEILSAEAFYLNIALFCFNLLLPAYPLDGGRVYAASLILFLKLKTMTAAKVTAITAMLISGGMMIYTLISILARSGGSYFLLGLVGVYVFYQSYELWVAAKRDELDQHPIFGRECYKQNNNAGVTRPAGVGTAGGGGNGDEEEAGEPVPAQTDEAVMT